MANKEAYLVRALKCRTISPYIKYCRNVLTHYFSNLQNFTTVHVYKFSSSWVIVQFQLDIGETELDIINLHHFLVPIGGRRSIITLVAPQYRCLGAHLLNDKRGNVVQSMHMANLGDPVGIMTAIFTQWLREDTECSWKKLIECMKICDLTHIAQEMEVALGFAVQGNLRV